MGGPKALVELAGEPLVRRALRVLGDAGCDPLVVVIGARAARVRALLAGGWSPPSGLVVVEAADWAQGMSASLRAGLAALEGLDVSAAVVHLVDLPGVTAAAVVRLIDDAGPETLRRAAYAGTPGHPVVLGRTHWAGVESDAAGDAGARGYLRGHPGLTLVECGDVATPDDVDTPEALARWQGGGPTPRSAPPRRSGSG